MHCLITFSLFVFVLVGRTVGKNLQCLNPNEIQEYVQECPPEKTCEKKDILFSCLNNNKRCQLKCVCKPGFYRIYNGDCVSGDICDRCSGPNEVYDCGSPCDTTCATLNEPCLIANFKCTEQCYCRKGFARNYKNICVPINECKYNITCKSDVNLLPERASFRAVKERASFRAVKGVCGPNEVYEVCKKNCPPDTCVSLVAKFNCPSDLPCVPGCVCKPYYLRAGPNSPCMQMRKCPELANSPDFNP